jgi:hypothetical protein
LGGAFAGALGKFKPYDSFGPLIVEMEPVRELHNQYGGSRIFDHDGGVPSSINFCHEETWDEWNNCPKIPTGGCNALTLQPNSQAKLLPLASLKMISMPEERNEPKFTNG